MVIFPGAGIFGGQLKDISSAVVKTQTMTIITAKRQQQQQKKGGNKKMSGIETSINSRLFVSLYGPICL